MATVSKVFSMPVPNSRYRLYYAVLGLASLIYVITSLFSPISPSAATYHLAPTTIHLLILSIVLPLVAVWFIALYGAVRFKAYTDLIKHSPDGRALSWLSDGLLVLVVSLVVPSIIGAFRRYVPDAIPAITVTTNYATIILLAVAFWFIYKGSRKLLPLVAANKRPGMTSRIIITLIVAILGVIYVTALLHNSYRSTSVDPGRINSYFLPDWLILSTICISYLTIWTFGLHAAVNIRAYLRGIGGTVYKQALWALVWGLVSVIVFSILLALLTALGPFLQNAGLGKVLGVVYLIVIAYAAGYVVIAYGARKLTKIEEVVG